MDILLSLLLLLLAARASGELAQRLKLPALLGEILAGVVLGPSLLGLVSPDAGITLLANLGIFFIVYLAALELTLKDVKRSIRESGVFIAITSFIIPLLSGVALGRLLALPLGSSMFLGIALAFTGLPVRPAVHRRPRIRVPCGLPRPQLRRRGVLRDAPRGRACHRGPGREGRPRRHGGGHPGIPGPDILRVHRPIRRREEPGRRAS